MTRIFSGELAIAKFDEAGGTDYPKNKVPVENLYGTGTRNGHWRESVLDNELLTGIYDGGGVGNPFSAITIASMGDLGYTDINLEAAEPYVLPFARSGPQPKTAGRKIELFNDIRQGPVAIVDANGRVVRVINEN